MAGVTVCWSAVGLIHDSFLNLSKTTMSEKYVQQIDENALKTATPRAITGQQKWPSSSPQ